MEIIPNKNEIRKSCKKIRREIPFNVKSTLDLKIAENFLSEDFYKNSDTILFYVSAEIEVGTLAIIETAFSHRKKVAVPLCVGYGNEMEFYSIESLAELKSGSFGILEPPKNEDNRIKSFENSLCVTPALAFDKFGFRVGYGKGFYDRFFSLHKELLKVGLVYESCFYSEILHDTHDIPVDFIVTENFIRKTEG